MPNTTSPNSNVVDFVRIGQRAPFPVGVTMTSTTDTAPAVDPYDVAERLYAAADALKLADLPATGTLAADLADALAEASQDTRRVVWEALVRPSGEVHVVERDTFDGLYVFADGDQASTYAAAHPGARYGATDLLDDTAGARLVASAVAELAEELAESEDEHQECDCTSNRVPGVLEGMNDGMEVQACSDCDRVPHEAVAAQLLAASIWGRVDTYTVPDGYGDGGERTVYRVLDRDGHPVVWRSGPLDVEGLPEDAVTIDPRDGAGVAVHRPASVQIVEVSGGRFRWVCSDHQEGSSILGDHGQVVVAAGRHVARQHLPVG